MSRRPALLRLLARLRDDRQGATAVVTALSLVTLLGFVGLGVDVGAAYVQRRSAQSAADSAAYSAAVARMGGTAALADQARAVAATYGFRDGRDGVTVTVHSPAQSGGMAGVADTVEVVVERPMARFFSQLFDPSAGRIRARAVAVAGASGDACVIAFNPNAAFTVSISGNSTVVLDKCSLYSNSSHAAGFQMTGSAAELRAEKVNLVAGAYALGGKPTLGAAVKLSQPPMADPYEAAPQPAKPQGCGYKGKEVSSGDQTFRPTDVFCDGLAISTNGKVTFEPGVYFIKGGEFRINGMAAVEARGVTFVLTDNGGPAATVNINGGAKVDFVAPTAGDTAGLMFFQDRNPRSGTGVSTINGGSGISIRGAVYLKKTQLEVAGTSAIGGGCLQLLADKIKLTGNQSLKVDCAGSGVRGLGGMTTALVE